MFSFTSSKSLVVLVIACIHMVVAQYPPTSAFSSILTSRLNPKITISYKEPPAGTCMTAFTTQKQYTGYITLPPYTLAPIQQNYTINTFFWFIEARQTPETAPLTIWLNGGPGTSSMFGLFNEVGPCEVVQMSDGSYGTQSRPWGWDRSTNILFIDQPNQVGFSYDEARNGSLNLLQEAIFEPPTPVPTSLPPFMYLNGTFGTQNQYNTMPGLTTANTTQIAAQAVWHFLQTWLSTFTQYNPATRPNTTTIPTAAAGIHLFTESYGGKYGPVMAAFFEQQNTLLANGSLPANSTVAVQLETVGIINGIIDDAIQIPYYPLFAYNNTYGIQTIDQGMQLNAINIAQNSCPASIGTCRTAMASNDPNGYGDNAVVNKICQDTQSLCNAVAEPYYAAGYDPYDIRQKYPSPDPSAAYQEYLNTAGVQAAIGARVNYTESNNYVYEAFTSTGDIMRGGQVEDLAALLTMGVRVALIYGDADYICNWYGGQAISLAIASKLPAANANQVLANPQTVAAYADAFPASGYADIITNSSYIGGAVRQYGNLSFSRIYDSGHFVPYYQPETAFTVFTRIIYGTSISTGQKIDLTNFRSSGPANATHANAAPPTPAQTCWVRAANSTCSQDQLDAIVQGRGFVAHGIYYGDDAAVTLPSSTVIAGIPGRPTSNSTFSTKGSASPTLTGVYTATSTPTPTGGSSGMSVPPGCACLVAILLGCIFSVQ